MRVELRLSTVRLLQTPDNSGKDFLPGKTLGGILKQSQRKGGSVHHTGTDGSRARFPLQQEDRGTRPHELYTKYMTNAGQMKDSVFQMSPTKANMINVIECAVITAERSQ